MKVMILAAGYGKRLRPFTDHTPKPLAEVAGNSLVGHHLDKLSAAGFQDVVMNLGHLGHKIPEALGDGSDRGLRIAYSDEGPDPLETGGGMAKALPMLGSKPFLLLNGDVWCDLDFAAIPRELPPDDDALLYLVPKPEWRERGDFALSPENRVTESESSELLYAGIAIYHPRILDGAKVEKFSIVPRLRAAISNNRVGGRLHQGDWDDVGTWERLEALRKRIPQKES